MKTHEMSIRKFKGISLADSRYRVTIANREDCPLCVPSSRSGILFTGFEIDFKGKPTESETL